MYIKLFKVHGYTSQRDHSELKVKPPFSGETTPAEKCLIGLDKNWYQVNIFSYFSRKHMLWVLIRSASAVSTGALLMSTQNICFLEVLLWRNKKRINTFGLKKASYQELLVCNSGQGMVPFSKGFTLK